MFKPESYYTLDSNMNLETLHCRAAFKTAITGKVTRYDNKQKRLEVKLGNGFIGYIPVEMSTIEEFTFPQNKQQDSISNPIPIQVSYLVGKTIRACVISCSNNEIILSRKKNQQNALTFIRSALATPNTTVHGVITSTAHYGLFVDIGEGIIGMVYVTEVSNRKINLNFPFFQKGQLIDVKIISTPEEKRIRLSLKQTFDPYEKQKENYSYGDIVIAKVLEELPDKSGYFCMINPQLSGIVDARDGIILHPTDRISVSVSKITNRGLRLRLISIL